jgi:hypothetical protein
VSAPDLSLLTARDFIGVRAGLVAALGNDANAALVLTRIAYRTEGGWHESHQTSEGRWWWRATYETIADETGLTRDQVKRAVLSLSRLGWIEGMTFRLEGPYDRTLSYSMAVPDDRADSPDERAGSPDVHRADSPDVPSTKTFKTLEGPKTSEQIETAFGRFYEVYPRRVGKGAARKAFTTALKKATAQTLVDGARLYAGVVQREQREAQYVKHPSAWLNGEHWEDDYGPVAGTGRDAIRRL